MGLRQGVGEMGAATASRTGGLMLRLTLAALTSVGYGKSDLFSNKGGNHEAHPGKQECADSEPPVHCQGASSGSAWKTGSPRPQSGQSPTALLIPGWRVFSIPCVLWDQCFKEGSRHRVVFSCDNGIRQSCGCGDSRTCRYRRCARFHWVLRERPGGRKG